MSAGRHRDHVITLRQPANTFRWSFGRQFRQPYLTTEAFDAMLWDLRPQPRNQRLPREDSNPIVHGLLESIYSGSRVRTETEQLESRAKIRLQSVRQNSMIHYGLQVMEKPDRGNLHRIGAVHTLGDKTPVGLHEFIFTGDTPESQAISCCAPMAQCQTIRLRENWQILDANIGSRSRNRA